MPVRRRRRLAAFRSGLTRALAGLRVIVAHPRLLVVPTVTTIAGVLVFLPLLWGLNRGGRWVLTIALQTFGPVALAGIPVVFALAAWVFLSVYAALVLLNSAVIIACTRRMLDGEQVTLTSGVRAAAGVAPQVLVFALAFGVIGLVLAAVERGSDWLGDLVAGVLGASVAVGTFFVLPAAVLDGTGPRESFRRSVEIVRASFAETAVLSLGIVPATVTLFALPWVVAVLGVPLVGVERANVLIETDPLLYGGVPVLSLWVGVIAGTSVGAVAKTGLYVAVGEDRESVPLLEVPVDEVVDVAD